MFLTRNTLISLILAVFITGITGCSTTKNLAGDGLSEDAFFDTAQDFMKKGNYELAIANLEILEERYPFGKYAEQVQLELIYAEYENSQYQEAVLDADRFIRFRPDNQQLDYVIYLKGLANFSMFVQRTGGFNDDPSSLDQSSGQAAYSAFKQLTQLYPDSQYFDQAALRMATLRHLFALHEIDVAVYYYKNNLPLASIARANHVLEFFANDIAQGDALAVLALVYNQLGKNQEEEQALTLLSAYYPNHPAFVEGEFTDPFVVENRLWLRVLTLGFFG